MFLAAPRAESGVRLSRRSTRMLILRSLCRVVDFSLVVTNSRIPHRIGSTIPKSIRPLISPKNHSTRRRRGTGSSTQNFEPKACGYVLL